MSFFESIFTLSIFDLSTGFMLLEATVILFFTEHNRSETLLLPDFYLSRISSIHIIIDVLM